MSDRLGTFRAGTSGYVYPHWKGTFYPQGLSNDDWFPYYAARFDSVEINYTFYNLPDRRVFEDWHDRAPDDFLYVLKFSRYGSHQRRLLEPEATIGLFLERASALQDHLGPILVQLPPRWKVNPRRLDRFLSAADPNLRWALEFRNPSWLCEEIYAILRKHGAALCIHDLIEDHPQEITADWTYYRFHGSGDGGAYSDYQLRTAAWRLRKLRLQGLDVFAYFNNDVGAHAPRNAQTLRRFVLGEDESAGESASGSTETFLYRP